MNSRDFVRLQHMIMCCESILQFTKGRKRTELSNDQLLDYAVRHQLQVLGEAANAISSKTKSLFPNIPWKQIIGLRNKLIHEYFDINYEIIWQTIKEELPSLLTELQQFVTNPLKEN